MAKIFINYRRKDSAPYAGRLYDRLAGHFGPDHVFMDIDQIEPGEVFDQVIQEKLKAVQAAVVLIGANWLDIAAANGQRRLDDPDDWVRLEIAALLERNIRVIPVLVGGAALPKSTQLPECLVPLTRRQAIEITDHRFHADVDKLIRALKRIVDVPAVSQSELPKKTDVDVNGNKPKKSSEEIVDVSVPPPSELPKVPEEQERIEKIQKTEKQGFSIFAVITGVIGIVLAAGFYFGGEIPPKSAPVELDSESQRVETIDVAPATEIKPIPPKKPITEKLQPEARELAAQPETETEQFKAAFIEPDMARIPPGKFLMGSPENDADSYDDERPQRLITIDYAFEIGKYEVTFDEYDAFAKATQRELPDDRGWGRGKRPVIDVSWSDAQDYVQWLSKQTGKQYRLPTEAEWEYAARAGTATHYWWGDDIGENNANCYGCGSQWDLEQTAPVGSFKANAFGLHDTAGNVWEWAQDCWHDNYDGAPTDGSAWLEKNGGNCSRRVVRGGSWRYIPRFLQSTVRGKGDSVGVLDGQGFRIARDF